MKNLKLLNVVVIGFAILIYGSSSFCARSDCAYIKSKDMLFVGVPNILEIKKYDGLSDNLMVKVAGEKYNPISNSAFEIYVPRPGKYKVEVFNLKTNTVISSQDFEAYYLPLTVSLRYVQPYKRTIFKNELLSQNGLVCQSLNWGYSVTFPIKQFSFMKTNGENKAPIRSNGSKFNTEQIEFIQALHAGEYLIIMDIEVELPNGGTAKTDPVIYEIK